MDRLNSLKKYLLGMNLAHVLVLSLVLKAIVKDISVAAFLVTIPVLSYEAYKLYLKHKTPTAIELNSQLRAELDLLKSKVNANTLEKNVKPAAIPRYF